MAPLPRIISVDDHVVEPPDLWQSRLPKQYLDRAPRVVRQRVVQTAVGKGGASAGWAVDPEGEWADVWYYDDVMFPFVMLFAAAGLGELGQTVTTFDHLLPASWKQADRLAMMDANHIEAAICFPNTLPRFCGQTFLEREDKELAALCVRAYNDWIIDDWSGGPATGRLLPVAIVPLWDSEACAAEIRRVAAKGCHAITFPENPVPLGLPSIHRPDRYWDPVFVACEETETVICMHIGSSSKMPTTGPDAPFIISSTLTAQNAQGSLLDYIFSGTLERFKTLKIAYSEGQVGWMPYLMERADKLWEERSANSFGSDLPMPPSSYIPGRVYACIFDDETGLRNRDLIGMSQICYETDFPHADSTYPHIKDTLELICTKAGLNDSEIYQLTRGNAIEAFGLQRRGITA